MDDRVLKIYNFITVTHNVIYEIIYKVIYGNKEINIPSFNLILIFIN